jgi:beta-galactosidase GanA
VVYIGGYLREPAVQAIAKMLPVDPVAIASENVEIIDRRSGKQRYIAMLNYGKNVEVVTGLPNGVDLISGRKLTDGQATLKPFDVAIIAAIP